MRELKTCMKRVSFLFVITLVLLFFACKPSTGGVQNGKEKGTEEEIFDESLPNIVFNIASEEELGKDEVSLILQVLGDGKGKSICIDWGDGEKKDYTFQVDEVSKISYKVGASAEVKLYGKLKLFDASAQKAIKNIRFYNSRMLETLRLSQNKIEKIDLLPLSSLKELQITDNKLTSIDVSSLSSLSELYCAWNKIAMLDVSKNVNLTVLTCYNTEITSLNLANNPLLEVLKAGDNKYSEVPVFTYNVNLKSIDFEHCHFTKINLKDLKRLEKAWLSGNKFSSIDLSNNKELIYLDVSNNEMESLDASELVRLETLMLNNNNLKNLDLKQNKRLNIVKLQNNLFSACSLNRIFDDVCLPLTKENGFGIKGNEGSATSNTSIAENKGWRLDMKGDGTATCE